MAGLVELIIFIIVVAVITWGVLYLVKMLPLGAFAGLVHVLVIVLAVVLIAWKAQPVIMAAL